MSKRLAERLAVDEPLLHQRTVELAKLPPEEKGGDSSSSSSSSSSSKPKEATTQTSTKALRLELRKEARDPFFQRPAPKAQESPPPEGGVHDVPV